MNLQAGEGEDVLPALSLAGGMIGAGAADIGGYVLLSPLIQDLR